MIDGYGVSDSKPLEPALSAEERKLWRVPRTPLSPPDAPMTMRSLTASDAAGIRSCGWS